MTTLWSSSVSSCSLPPIPSAFWLLLSLVISQLRLDSTPFPRQVLSLHTCPLLWANCGLHAPLPCSLGCWQEAFPFSLHPVPFGNTLHSRDYFFWQQVSAVRKTEPSWSEGGRKGGGKMRPKWKGTPSQEL